MSKKRKFNQVQSVKMPRFFLRPFLPYLRPHKLKLVVAFFGMFAVGFFGSFSILLVIPSLEILFGGGLEKEADKAVQTALADNYEAFAQAVEARRGADPDAQDAVYRGLGELTDALDKREALKRKRDGEEEELENLSDAVPALRGVRQWAENLFQPIRDAAKRNWERIQAWMMANPLSALGILAGLLVGTTFLKAVSEYISKYFLSYTLYHAVIKIREDIFRHVMKLDYGFFIRSTTGFLENRISGDVNKIKAIFDALISDAVQQPIQLFFTIALLFFISPKLTVITLACVAFGFWPLIYFANKIKRVTKKSKKKEDELSSSADESLRNFRAVKVFGAEEFEIAKFRRLNDRLFVLFMKRRIARFASSPIMEMIGSVGAAAVLVVGGILVLGTENAGPMLKPHYFIGYLLALSRVYTPMKKLSRLNINWQVASVSAARIQEMLRIESEVKEAPNARPIERFERALEFKDVSYTYDEKPVLDGVSFRLQKGKVLALVGRSGAGKTTLANMLPRLFDPTGGVIEIDGAPCTEFKLTDLRRLFGVVTQETILFNDSVQANIAYGQERADPQRLEAAAKAAYAHDFIMELEGGQGYQTVIGQGGQSLSGGQRQRLAIARALYRDPEILIFDEATSSLDVESERFVQRAIDNLLQGRTALIIAHRLSTIRHADEILVMHDGRIVERGTHQELLRARGEYFRLHHIAGDLEDRVSVTDSA